MKHALVLLAVAALAPPALAEETIIPFTDAATFFPAALGKQVNVRFSQSFAASHLGKTDLDSLILSELPEGKACFFGHDQGLDPDDPKLADVARTDQGDVCVSEADVSVRVKPQLVEGAPPVPFYSTDASACTWNWLKGKDLGLWAESCKMESGAWAVAYDAAKDIFTLNLEGSDPYPVLREFHKQPDEAPDVLLPQLRQAKLIPDDDECKFAPAENLNSPAGWSLWEVVPVGKKKEAFDANSDDEEADPPCGDLGYAIDYVGFFMIPEAHKDRVIHVDLGQDGTLFDPFTVTPF